eukprot:jgi/Mesvir1/2440/Mv22170-RA.1
MGGQASRAQSFTGSLPATRLYFDIPSTKEPLVYSPGYNMSLLGLENMHPLDSKKWGRAFQLLVEADFVTPERSVEPYEAEESDLLVVHTKEYLNSLTYSFTVAQITELLPLAMIPNWVLQRQLLRKLRLQTGGTILAGKLATERGWAINLGGGFHHCSADRGGGFCAYADISLCIEFAFRRLGLERVMVIDLDAHQGNGYARDFMNDARVYILDMFNDLIYPQDFEARAAIRKPVGLKPYTKDPKYLALLEAALVEAGNEFQPQLVIYNAGTDLLEGDPLGRLSVTPEGVVRRDQIVFSWAASKNAPIVMLTSGGYQRSNAAVIADSIKNLARQRLITLGPAGLP